MAHPPSKQHGGPNDVDDAASRRDPKSRDSYLFEGPRPNPPHPDDECIIDHNIVASNGLHAAGVWDQVKDLRRRDLFHLIDMTEKGHNNNVPPPLRDVQLDVLYRIGQALKDHHGMDYPNNVYVCSCCA